VVVTGAGGRTGGLIVKQLLEKADNSVVGTVRSKASSSKLHFDAEKATLVELDLAAAAAAANEADNAALKEFAAALQGADALVICTRWVQACMHSCATLYGGVSCNIFRGACVSLACLLLRTVVQLPLLL
jgi:NAD(P)-dependent dehydrogenase (short-subunit alcohol dehydrogenase family)